MLRNWLLGCLAIAIWLVNYLAYFAPDILAWWRRRRLDAMMDAGGRGLDGRLPFASPPSRSGRMPAPRPSRPAPPPAAPPPPAVPPRREAEIIPFPQRRRPRP
ncbi:conserved protein of unknown function [Rhodovastum atsumiense]|uniref:Uncharacterized protein n=1 Tax=Rhodovastum atsumiense TaxID=504468 RepID=A0A5M6IY79_9PROT|nr:hypothetical protein [Rhodovastum atsumiense]KAA5613300.1 hypothetical protein F1189_06315 [Rhodovastum atsumiense]CAH2600527.1 conserved protein of unknown function [Rhodovastum atsumiense]